MKRTVGICILRMLQAVLLLGRHGSLRRIVDLKRSNPKLGPKTISLHRATRGSVKSPTSVLTATLGKPYTVRDMYAPVHHHIGIGSLSMQGARCANFEVQRARNVWFGMRHKKKVLPRVVCLCGAVGVGGECHGVK